ncbi:hypothetical protein MNB_SV-5-1033 [hydrothermal vent metagenome]|uniref:Uncharacterized protein n=1 Tax=hydrothermal vent metagenome TaxID=652676 RepID=A0A1W1EEF8_9ZZZZ
MKTIITASIIAASLISLAQAETLSPAAEQACAAEAAAIKNVKMSEIRTERAVRWADGTGAVVLKLPGKKDGVCWVSAKGEVEQVVFGTGVEPAQEQACASEAAAIKKVRMSAIRAPWSVEGPKGSAWVVLTLKNKKMDCHVSGTAEVLEVASYR